MDPRCGSGSTVSAAVGSADGVKGEVGCSAVGGDDEVKKVTAKSGEPLECNYDLG
ncbi:hypothetical protein OG828_28430 [Streptomyces sp. NBC_00457]|uniref:hypothetical protein n=1 Tax=Streptomyces sp. NBC_00457 TaxID=2975748 RepID=UPI002E1EB7F6